AMTDAARQAIYWFTPEQTPYHHFFFRQLSSAGFKLLVHYDPLAMMHPWIDQLPHPDYSVSVWTWLRGISTVAAQHPRPIIVVSGWNKPKYVALLMLLCAGRIYFVFWTDTPAVD